MKHKQFGEYIRLMRKDKKMSGPAFGKLIGVTKSYISQIENGNTAPPSDEVIYRMSGVLNEDVDFLFSLAGRISSDLIPIILKNPVIIADMIRNLKHLSRGKLELAADYVENI